MPVLKSDERDEILVQAMAYNKGVVETDEVFDIYGSYQQAKSALNKLDSEGWIKKEVPGRFKVVRAPEDLKEEAKKRQKAGYP